MGSNGTNTAGGKLANWKIYEVRGATRSKKLMIGEKGMGWCERGQPRDGTLGKKMDLRESKPPRESKEPPGSSREPRKAQVPGGLIDRFLKVDGGPALGLQDCI